MLHIPHNWHFLHKKTDGVRVLYANFFLRQLAINTFGIFIPYYKRRKGGEVDFILDEQQALEVKNKAIPQYIQDLSRKAKTLDIRDYYVVSKAFVDDKYEWLLQEE
ncbi:hypothetical protein COW99_02780 [Candidatus Roizmanbacteria bacterium CG22_combo_CG10-13_8_21_14_all_38_20]|uniref:DUF4143 domain-containing protein n=1 Tax=Candidatus Roizmanbacteria bacterium CG22_combo_CG10-13_8_21_14_all_38_20 TaxID=1974862 RepID=A0A2H0BVG0_9BACT|nr:MAG: hypothetical protein COW99_02780 [Candidatus Roizmanbacteria bacterium CG22_combo_CG10-13_8_21_14_all_38_20]PJC31377.1 MAG: hypothetical protein CO050_03320 [Candidatus Roizmanbacteria bacterium CG_4_9_14_0_2_um_filter_38_17]